MAAYPIVKHHGHFLCFVWHNVPYQWKVLPFGFATAPRVFHPSPNLFRFFAVAKVCILLLGRGHIALQELQAVAIMVCRMAFHLSGKVPCIWITVLLRLTFVIKVVQCLLFFRLACWILSLTKKYGITLLPAYNPTHLSVEADYLSWD